MYSLLDTNQLFEFAGTRLYTSMAGSQARKAK